jgi:hypothetical protein
MLLTDVSGQPVGTYSRGKKFKDFLSLKIGVLLTVTEPGDVFHTDISR